MNKCRVLFTLILLTGCSGVPEEGDDRESIGPEENEGRGAVGPDVSEVRAPLVATLNEEVRIDGREEALVPIDRLVIGSSDDVVLMQYQEAGVRYFDSAGTEIGSFGGQGEGPGEFTALYSIGQVGDTLWMWDSALSRMTLVSPERELVRTWLMSSSELQDVPPELVDVVSGRRLFVEGYRAADDLIYQVVSAGQAGAPFREPYADHVVLARMTSDGRFKGVSVNVSHGGPVSFPTGRGAGWVAVPPLLRNPVQVSVSDDGNRIASAVTSLVGNQADSFAVTLWTHEGNAIWRRTVPFDRVPLPQTVADSVIASVQSSGLPPVSFEALQRNILVPDVYPPLTGITIGRDRSVWIEMRENQRGQQYVVLTSVGDLQGTVMLPTNSRLGAADLEHVWSIEQDDVGVESVVRYGITWN